MHSQLGLVRRGRCYNELAKDAMPCLMRSWSEPRGLAPLCKLLPVALQKASSKSRFHGEASVEDACA
eukprot:6032474-Amphidinium_carterae.1